MDTPQCYLLSNMSETMDDKIEKINDYYRCILPRNDLEFSTFIQTCPAKPDIHSLKVNNYKGPSNLNWQAYLSIRTNWSHCPFRKTGRTLDWEEVGESFLLMGFNDCFIWIRCPKCSRDFFNISGYTVVDCSYCENLDPQPISQPTKYDFTNCREETIYKELCPVCTRHANICNEGSEILPTDVFNLEGKIKHHRLEGNLSPQRSMNHLNALDCTAFAPLFQLPVCTSYCDFNCPFTHNIMEKDVIKENNKSNIYNAFDVINRYSNFLKMSMLVPQNEMAECSLLVFHVSGFNDNLCYQCIIEKIEANLSVNATKIKFLGSLGNKARVLNLLEYMFCSNCERCLLFSSDINYRKQCMKTITEKFNNPIYRAYIGVAISYCRNHYPNKFCSSWTNDMTLWTDITTMFGYHEIDIQVMKEIKNEQYRYILNSTMVTKMI